MAILSGGFIGPLSGNAVLAMIPALKIEFGVGAEEILLSITIFMLPFAFFNLFSGTISDVYGRRRLLTVGFIIYAIGGMACALSQDLSSFYLGRAIQGFGYAFVNPVLLAILGDMIPAHERGKVMGYFGAFTTAGIASGPMIAGFLTAYSWRWMFLLVAIMALTVGLWIRSSCPVVRRDPEAMHHLQGNVTRAIKTPGVLTLSLLGFLVFMCYMGALGFLSDHLSLDPLSLDETTIGILVGMSGVAGMVAAPIGGRLVDVMGRIFTAAAGLLTIAAAILLLWISSDRIGFALSLLVLGTGTAFIWASLLTLTVEIVPDLRGTVSSLFNSIRFFGYSLAPMVFAPIYAGYGFGSVLLAGLSMTVLSLPILLLLGHQLRDSQESSTRSS